MTRLDTLLPREYNMVQPLGRAVGGFMELDIIHPSTGSEMRTKHTSTKRTCTRMTRAVLVLVARPWKQPKCP